MWRSKTLYFLLLFVLLQTNLPAFAQDSSFSINEWVKKLSAKDDIDNKCVEEISRILNAKDSAFAFSGLNELERNGSSSHYFKARFFCIKANDIFVFKHSGGKSAVRQMGELSLKEAYETDDEYLISFASWAAGVMTGLHNEVELSATYFLKAEEIIEHLEKKPLFSNSLWLNLGEMLYHAREYEKCVDFVKKGLANWHDTAAAADYYRIRFWNTVGQAYKQLGQLDSAMANYRRSMQLVDKLNIPIWRGINNVNIGELYFLEKDYEKAKQLIQYEYKVKYTDEPNVSAYGLQLLARINLAENRKDSALLHIKEALELLKNSNDLLVQKMNYLQLAYNTAADVYRAMGNSDSFYRYSQLYAYLHDSLERVATLSSIKMAQLRINNEKNYHAIQQLTRQKEAEKQKRNFIITFLIALSVIVILILSRQKQRLKYKGKLALLEKVAAKEQLENFTQNLIEKTILIEKLEKRINVNENSGEQQQLVEELAHQTILTEDDWLKFKILFEKTYSGFFTRLKEKVNDITLAEQRMAALTRLHLTTRQKAAVLGISPNSVIKTKQRLRDRFDFETDLQVEEFLAKL